MRKYQKTHGDPEKEVPPMRVKEHPGLDDSPFLNEKEHKYSQNIIGLYQWMIVSGRFDFVYAISQLIRLLAAPQVGHINLVKIRFGYLKMYPKRGYAINPQPLTIDDNYERVQMKYDFGNQYSYFSEEIDEQFPEPLLGSFGIYMFWGANSGHYKVTVKLVTEFFSVVV